MKYTILFKSIFKILFLGIITFIILPLKAQPHLCNDSCPPSAVQWKTIALCKFTNTIYFSGGGSETITNAPFVFVMIAYRIRTCNGITSIIIDDYVFVDNRDWWNNVAYNWGITNPPTIPVSQANACPYPPATIKQAITDAITELLTQIGNPAQGNYEIYFKGACHSLVTLSFPDGAFFVGSPDDLGHIDTFYVSAGSTVTQSIPCNDVCCKVTYQWRVIILQNGETTSKWVLISYDGDGGNCESQAMPDYNLYIPKLEATIYDPITGQYNKVTGTLVSQEPCELTCPRFVAPPPPDPAASVKTDLSSKDVQLQLLASPIPFSNFIYISGNKPVTKVVIYDMNGKKLLTFTNLENGELNTVELKAGAYFVQVYFANNIVKSIKVIKQ